MGCQLASLDDLTAMKLAAISQRGSRKDFLDIYELGIKHAPLKRMLELYEQKYAVDDIGHVLLGLSYFDDAEREPMPMVIWGIN
jgi:predicted nucleotidyltransferase component of viral defense system